MKLRARPWLLLAASFIIAVSFWHWAKAILVPAYTAKVLAEKRPVGNNSDLYPRWLGARELLLHGRDPYGAEVSREMQTGFYGRPLDPQNPADPTARAAFVYPLYVVFLLAPSVTWSFDTVAQVFRWLLLASIACSIPLWMRALKIRLVRPMLIAGMLLALASYPAVEEYFQQNLTALVIFFLAAAAAAASRNWLILSGFLLALATMKPDTTGLVILWFLFWVAGNWKQRGRLFWGFTGTMAALLLSSEAISPGWIPRFVAAVREYPAYGTDPTVLQALMPHWLAQFLAVALIIFLAGICWQCRRAAAASEQFGWALASVAAVTLVVLPKLAAYNQLLLIPALLVLARAYSRLPTAGFLRRVMTKAAFACQVWQWCAAALLAICSLFVSVPRLRSVAEVPLYTLLAFPFLTLLTVAFSIPAIAGGKPPE
ncbi:MAG: glycosyltransferase family 87 protein [Candidatus Sulfotelmatobacter sp.]